MHLSGYRKAAAAIYLERARKAFAHRPQKGIKWRRLERVVTVDLAAAVRSLNTAN